MKKQIRLLALLTALVLALAAAPALAEKDDDDSQDRYWEESGRAWLSRTLYEGGGRVLSSSERAAFFNTYAVTMTQILYSGTGYFAVNGDGSFAGRYAETWEGETQSSDFSGRFTEVVQLGNYTYALRTEQIYWASHDLPEAMQETMLFTVPGIRSGTDGALNFEIKGIAEYYGLNVRDPLPCYFITAFDSAPTWFSGLSSVISDAVQNTGSVPSSGGELYGLAIQKLATRKGPGTQYEEGGTYQVRGQYIRILSRAWDKRNGIWWVKCEIPYKNKIRVLWTGWKRFDHSSVSLESIPVDPEY